ncbi:MAG: hypothetical protein ACKO1N_12805 [Erythrobacter sp.]
MGTRGDHIHALADHVARCGGLLGSGLVVLRPTVLPGLAGMALGSGQ